MVVGIPLCEYGACLREAVEVCQTSPPSAVYAGDEVKLCRPLPLCEVHLLMLRVWHERYARDPDCKVRIG